MDTQTPEKNGAAAKAPATDKALAQTEEKTIVSQVTGMVNGYLQKNTLHLPEGYSVENALKSAWLYLCEALDKDKKPLLNTCTRASVVNSLLDYCIQGLNTSKKQAYFIAYGNKCVMQRSYFGDELVAKRVMPGIELYYGVIREGDEVSIDIVKGRNIIKVTTTWERANNPLAGVYCGVLAADGEDLGAEIMTMEQVRKSWSMSKTYNPGNENGTHTKFAEDMALRTVRRKRCKPIFNASNDEELLRSIERNALDTADAEMDAEVEANANQDFIDVQISDVHEDTGEVRESTESTKEEPEKQAEGSGPGF